MGVHQLSYPRGCLKRLMVESPKKNKKKHDPVLRDRHSRMENGGWSLKPQTKHGMFFCSKDTNTFFVCVSLWGWDILNQLAPQTTTLAMGISLVNNCVGKPPPWLPYICLAIWGSRIQTSWIYACRDSDFMRVNTVFIRIIRTQQKNLMFSVPSRKYRGKHERTIETSVTTSFKNNSFWTTHAGSTSPSMRVWLKIPCPSLPWQTMTNNPMVYHNSISQFIPHETYGMCWSKYVPPIFSYDFCSP